jgi:hypothetical protein
MLRASASAPWQYSISRRRIALASPGERGGVGGGGEGAAAVRSVSWLHCTRLVLENYASNCGEVEAERDAEEEGQEAPPPQLFVQEVYIHTYVYTYIHTHIHTYTHTYIHAYV